MEPLLDIVKVEARPDHTLWLEFENGEQRIFEMKPLGSPFNRSLEWGAARVQACCAGGAFRIPIDATIWDR